MEVTSLGEAPFGWVRSVPTHWGLISNYPHTAWTAYHGRGSKSLIKPMHQKLAKDPWDHSMGKGTDHQAYRPEKDPWEPSWQKEKTASQKLSSDFHMCVLDTCTPPTHSYYINQYFSTLKHFKEITKKGVK